MFDRANLDSRFLELLNFRIKPDETKVEVKKTEKVEKAKVEKAKPKVASLPKVKLSIKLAKEKVEEEKEILREMTKRRIAQEATAIKPLEKPLEKPLVAIESLASSVIRKKKVISPEHLAKMRAGLLAKRANKKTPPE